MGFDHYVEDEAVAMGRRWVAPIQSGAWSNHHDIWSFRKDLSISKRRIVWQKRGTLIKKLKRNQIKRQRKRSWQSVIRKN